MLLLAGDASEDIRVLEQTLTCLRDTFGKVFFLPGKWSNVRSIMKEVHQAC